MQVIPLTPARLVDRIVALVAARPGRVRLILDGPPPTAPVPLALAVGAGLRVLGRDTVVVDAHDFLRPASVRLEYGHHDPDSFLDGWLDDGALRREVLDPAVDGGTGRILRRLWDADVDRAYREPYTTLPADGVVLLAGALLLGRGLPVDLSVHLQMGAAALRRRLAQQEHWTLPAYARSAAEQRSDGADVVVLADHPDRPAVRSS